MSIEIGQKYIGKDGEVVEVEDIVNYKTYIWFFAKGKRRALIKHSFLEQYKPYEEPKHTVMIEKWLMQTKHANYKTHFILEASREEIELHEKGAYEAKPVKLLDTYEVTL